MMYFAKRIGLILCFFSLAGGGFLTVTADIPEGPWVGMYSSFWGIWASVSFALVLLLILIQYSDLSWSVVLVTSILSALVIVNLSRLWGVPFGIRDPYTHLHFIKNNIYNFGDNVYPIFHIFVRTLSSITGVSAMAILGSVSLLASAIGVGLLLLVLRRLGLEKRVQQTAVVAGVPIVSTGVIARPYTLGIVYILLFLWIITTGIRHRSIQAVLILSIIGVLWLHAIPFLVGSAVVVTAIAVRLFLERYPITAFQPPPAGWWVRMSFIILLIGAFTIHMFFFSSIGRNVVGQITDEIPSAYSSELQETSSESASSSAESQNQETSSESASSSAESQNQETSSESASSSEGTNRNTPLLFQIQTNFFEFLTRASLGLLLLAAAGFVSFHELITKRFHYSTIIIGISGTLVLLFFVFIDVGPISTFGPRRILAFAPILLFPLLGRLLQIGHIRRLLIAVLVLTSGMATMYESPVMTGGVSSSATMAQIEGYQWYHDYGTTSIVGSGSTFAIAEGLYGPEVADEWKGEIQRNSRRDALYSWQITGRPAHILAISGHARAQAQNQATEDGVIQPIVTLERYQITNDRNYDNGNLRFYQNDGP